MSKQSADKSPPITPDAGESANLDRQYGNIGISAVAAALPYRGEAKNPRYARKGEDSGARHSSRKRSVLSV